MHNVLCVAPLFERRCHPTAPAAERISTKRAPDITHVVSVDWRAVKEAVITQLARELCIVLQQSASGSSFDVSEEIMMQGSASALTATQHKVI